MAKTTISNTDIEAMKKIELEGTNNPFTILIIDDDKWIHRVLSRYLIEWDFNVISAYSPYEGMALAIKYRPVLIFLDLIMPEISGDYLLKMFKMIEMTADIPIIMISGNLTPKALGDAYKYGAAAFISKPFSQSILFKKIEESLQPSVFNSLNINYQDTDLKGISKPPV